MVLSYDRTTSEADALDIWTGEVHANASKLRVSCCLSREAVGK